MISEGKMKIVPVPITLLSFLIETSDLQRKLGEKTEFTTG
jgi:hypothetical protein